VGDKDKLSSEDRRASKDRRSGTDTRSDEISLGESAWAARGCAVRVTDGENTELYRTPLDAIPIWAKTRGSA
jgi:hypothetical protein